MKVALTGTHSSGKTTLLNELRNEPLLKGYQLFDSWTRKLKEKGLPINKGAGLNMNLTQLLCLNAHLDSLVYDNSFADRALIDALAYTLYLKKEGQIDSWVVDYGEKLVQNYHSNYDLIFFCSTKGVPLVNDGVRAVDPLFREQVESILLGLLQKYRGDLFSGPKVIQLTGSVEERKSIVLYEMKGLIR